MYTLRCRLGINYRLQDKYLYHMDDIDALYDIFDKKEMVHSMRAFNYTEILTENGIEYIINHILTSPSVKLNDRIFSDNELNKCASVLLRHIKLFDEYVINIINILKEMKPIESISEKSDLILFLYYKEQPKNYILYRDAEMTYKTNISLKSYVLTSDDKEDEKIRNIILDYVEPFNKEYIIRILRKEGLLL